MKRAAVSGLAILIGAFLVGRAFAEPFVQAVQPVLYNPKSMLVQSGVSFDAHEDLLGIVHVQEPKSFFKPDIKQVTWWGEFKPFKFWGKPQIEAIWYAPPPPGQEIAKQNFTGGICVLAKSTLKLSQSVTEGTWRVDIYSKGEKIDSKNFVIYGGEKPVLNTQTPASVEIQANAHQG